MKAFAVPVPSASSPAFQDAGLLLWPMVAVLGFLAMAGLVIALGRGSTARYEYERNRVRDQAQQPAAAMAAAVPAAVREPASAPGGGSSGGTAVAEELPAARPGTAQMTAVGVAAHPAGKRAADDASVPAWWLVDGCGEDLVPRVVAGPFPDRIEADWAALANGLSEGTRPVYGTQRSDGAVARRQSPHDRLWLTELDGHLQRLPEDWDELLSDTDALTTLVVEVGAALLEAGLPLHDCDGRGDGGGSPSGGVCLTPELGAPGILVTWRPHDRMCVQQVRGGAAASAVQRTMTTAAAHVLAQLGFQVESVPAAGCYRVTSGRVQMA